MLTFFSLVDILTHFLIILQNIKNVTQQHPVYKYFSITFKLKPLNKKIICFLLLLT